MSKINRSLTTLVLALATFFIVGSGVATANESVVRAAVQRVFDQLKSRDYSALYDLLPASQRARMSRDRFVNALQRAQDMYVLDRLEVGTVKVAGNLAVVDTVLYGRVVNPIQAEGKIVVQQYLLREDGKWRVATGDQAAVRKFLAASPGFKKGFKLSQPRVYIKQNGKWLEFNPGGKQAKPLAQHKVVKCHLCIIDSLFVFTVPNAMAGHFQRLSDGVKMKADYSRS